MSAGNLLGSVANTLLFGGVWLVLGVVVDRVAHIANLMFATMVVYEDGVQTFNMLAGFWAFICVVVVAGIWINYFLVENSRASQEV